MTVTENIVQCVDRSQKFLMILSNSFLQSQWCLFETHVAQHQMVQENRFEFCLNCFEINQGIFQGLYPPCTQGKYHQKDTNRYPLLVEDKDISKMARNSLEAASILVETQTISFNL